MDLRKDFSRYAILIGIDEYQEKPLKSCVRDIRGVKTYLESVLRDHTAIRTITAPLDDTSSLWPTRENVISEFRNVTSQARPGDFVYIHFSGHGTQKPPCGEFSNESTGDLALVLLSDAKSLPTYLWGFELAELLKAMVKKGLLVTLVLDCCFSASVYRRDDPAVRFHPYNPKFDLPHSLDLGQNPHFTNSHLTRDACMRSNWLMDPNGYAILTACGPHEETDGYLFNGQNYGALSYFLINILKCVGLTKRHRELHHHLRAKFQGSNIRQTTMLYGNKNQGFFGPVNSETTAAIVSVTKSNGILQLEAGRAHGVSDGDRFVLFPLAAHGDDLRLQSVSVIARVIHTRGLTSVLEPEQSAAPARTGWMARPETQACLRKYPIGLTALLPHPQQNDWTLALESRSLDVYAGTDVSPCAFHVVLKDEKEYSILDELGHEIINLPRLLQALASAGQVGDILEHLARFRFARDLVNDAYGPFNQSFDVRMRAGGVDVSPGNLLEVKSGVRVEVIIKNKSERPIFAFIYDLGPLWQVQDIYHGVLVMPQGTRRKGIKLSLPSELKEKGIASCEDTIKVILTSRHTSFDILELPKMGRQSIAKRVDRTGQTEGNATEDWAALNFNLRTTVS